jgi:hypothetical protein
MSGTVTLRVTDVAGPALEGTQAIPVLTGVPALTGFNPANGPAAALATLADLATFFAANVAGVATVTSTSATAVTVGPAGATDPVLQIDASTASQKSGLKVKGGTTTGTVALSAISNGANVSLTIDGKGSGTIGIGTISTGRISLGVAAGTNGVTIDGTGYGAGVASLRLNGLTTAAVATEAGTLLNAPVAGNPAFWIPINIAGTVRYCPAW